MGLEERQDPSDCQGTLRQGKYMYIEEGGILPVIRWIKREFRSKNQIGIRSMTIFIKIFKDIVLPDLTVKYLFVIIIRLLIAECTYNLYCLS